MPTIAAQTDQEFLKAAFKEALASYRQGGIPIGAVMVENGNIIGRGHNQRVQLNDPIAHGEMDCIRNAGRRASYKDVTLYTTLTPA
jgi:creatinine deaminase